jgi:hypothetical protein
MIGPIVSSGSAEPLDDDQVAAATGINRAYVAYSCRRLVIKGIIVRQRGGGSHAVVGLVDIFPPRRPRERPGDLGRRPPFTPALEVAGTIPKRRLNQAGVDNKAA